MTDLARARITVTIATLRAEADALERLLVSPPANDDTPVPPTWEEFHSWYAKRDAEGQAGTEREDWAATCAAFSPSPPTKWIQYVRKAFAPAGGRRRGRRKNPRK